MARDETQYYDGIINMTMLKTEMRNFLTTHKDGVSQLILWMRSVPENRTREEYFAKLAKDDALYEAHRAEALVRINRDRAARGEDPIEFRELSGPEALEW
jgi:hypothetical protein